jgi:hypothetical protein
MSWRGSPAVGQPSTLLPLPLAAFWPPQGAGFWRSPPLGQSSSTPPPQPDQGYMLPPMPMSWAPPPGGQPLPPFGMPLWMTPYRPTSSPPTVSQVYANSI